MLPAGQKQVNKGAHTVFGYMGALDPEPGNSHTAALHSAGHPWAVSLRAQPPHPRELPWG